MESYNFPAQRERGLCSPGGEGLKVLTRVMRRGLLGERAGTCSDPGRKGNSDRHRRQREKQDLPGAKAWWASRKVHGAAKTVANTSGCG